LTRRLLGVSHEHANFDPTGAQATEAGHRFGLIGWWPSDWSAAPSDVTDTLAIDEQGLASAWRKSYGGAPGTGFVRLFGSQWTSVGLAPEQLKAVWIAAERLPR
jgi:hypothetical protein